MSDFNFNIELETYAGARSDAAALVAYFEQANERVMEALRPKLADLALLGRDNAVAFAPVKTGALASGIEAITYVGDYAAYINIYQETVFYASTQEKGADVPAHEIPAKGKAMAFTVLAEGKSTAFGDIAFAKRVAHPGGHIPGKFYLQQALETIRNGFYLSVVDAIEEAMKA